MPIKVSMVRAIIAAMAATWCVVGAGVVVAIVEVPATVAAIVIS